MSSPFPKKFNISVLGEKFTIIFYKITYKILKFDVKIPLNSINCNIAKNSLKNLKFRYEMLTKFTFRDIISPKVGGVIREGNRNGKKSR